MVRIKRPPALQSDGSYAIPLTQGAIAYIDAADLPLVEHVNWCLQTNKHLPNPQRYAFATRDGKSLFLHRVILGLAHGDPREGDHVDQDRMNCRRSNLRIVSRRQNAWNRSTTRLTRAGKFKGVRRKGTNYAAMVWPRLDGAPVRISGFRTPEEAAMAFNILARRHYGEFAYLNSVEMG
jgi:hypothetical protein